MTREEAKTCESRPWQCLLQHGLLPTALPVQQDKNRRQKSKGVPSGFINFTLTQEEDGTRSFPEPGISHILCGGFNMSVVVVVNSLSGYISTPKTSIILTIRKGVCPHPQKTPKDSSWSFSSSKTALGAQRAQKNAQRSPLSYSDMPYRMSARNTTSSWSQQASRGNRSPIRPFSSGQLYPRKVTVLACDKFVTAKCFLQMEG